MVSRQTYPLLFDPILCSTLEVSWHPITTPSCLLSFVFFTNHNGTMSRGGNVELVHHTTLVQVAMNSFAKVQNKTRFSRVESPHPSL